MLPLGDFWNGECHAAAPTPIDNTVFLQTCNLGYARASCPHFPALVPTDAVRFTISRDDGDTVRIYYVMERDHHPLSHGALEYSRARGALLDSAVHPTVRRQAAAYAESYLERMRETHAAR